MSVYALNRLCRDVLSDEALRERLASEPDAVFDAYGLASAERTALSEGDVATLYMWGVNAFLMGNLPRFGLFGLTNRIYNERIRTAS